MSDEIKDKISLENINYQMKNQRLTSPLSIKACKLKGVTEEDLKYITFEQYINSHPESKNLPKEFQQERYDNYEQNRRDLIESLKEVRNDLKKSLEKQIKRTKTLSEENDDDKDKDKRTKTINNEDLRKKLKDNMENNIKILISKEFEKKNKLRTKSKKDLNSPAKLSKNSNKISYSKDKYKSETKVNKEKNLKYQQFLLEKREKIYFQKEENIRRHLEEIRNEFNKKRSEESQQKKAKISLALTRNEEKLHEKINTFYKMKQKKEERIEKREKEKIEELNKKYQEENKKKSERLKAAILRNEEFKNKKIEEYNRRIIELNKNLLKKELKEKEKIMKQKTLNELRESKLNKRKIQLKNKEEHEKAKYFEKQEKLIERLRSTKKEREREKMVKLNKEFILTNNIKIKHMREQSANEYKMLLKLENMDKKRQLYNELKEKKFEEWAEQRKMKEEINKDKQAMMGRLKEIMNSNHKYTKDEVNDYVLNGIKPGKNKNDESVRNKTVDVDKNKKKESGYDFKKAFVTDYP